MNEKVKSGQIVKNKSNGHNYKYSNLADLHRAGINIPKMKTMRVEGDEYVMYWDGSEWQQGAKVVPIESKIMNPAQAYGASLTYARRYTVQMAESVACDDDDAIEQAPAGDIQAKNKRGINFDDIRSALAVMDDEESVKGYAQELKKMFPNPTEKQTAFIKKMLADRIKEIRGEL